jgi:hypothetical protein
MGCKQQGHGARVFNPSSAQIMSPHILDARHGWTYMVYDSMFALLGFDLVFVGLFFCFYQHWGLMLVRQARYHLSYSTGNDHFFLSPHSSLLQRDVLFCISGASGC